MNLISRSKCCVCKSSSLEELLNLQDFPIYMGTTVKPLETDLYANQEWVCCNNCGCTQLKKLVPLEVLYSNQHSAGAVGQIWIEHHRAFAKFILKGGERDICEIGAAHGELSRIILEAAPEIDYLVIEPDPGQVHPKAKVLRGYVEDFYDEISSYSNIVHSHVLEHIYEPAVFLESVSRRMDVGARMYVSFPNIAKLLEKRGTNSLNFEHTYFLHPKQVESLIKLYGMELIDQEEYLDHSYFMCLEKKLESVSNSGEIASITFTKNMLTDMWEELSEFVNRTNALLVDSNIPTYVFGAHVFTQGLINLGLETKSITGVLDNSNTKVGQRLYGTHLMVFHPNQIALMKSVRVILKVSHYQEEIKNQLLLINPSVEIIE